MFKQCTNCTEWKPIDDFYIHQNGKPRTQCKVCMLSAHREHYKENPTVKRAANKRHRQQNPEYYKNYHIKYYGDNREKILNRTRDFVASVAGRSKLIFNSAKRRATKDGREFTLTVDRIEHALMIGLCERTMIAFDLQSTDQTFRNPFAPSIDRKDNGKGYTNENVQIVVNLYNTGKGEHTDEEFIRFCHAVAVCNPLK